MGAGGERPGARRADRADRADRGSGRGPEGGPARAGGGSAARAGAQASLGRRLTCERPPDPLPPPLPPADAQIVLPPTVPATLAYMHETGAYLISNGSLLILWIGRSADPGLVSQVGAGGRAPWLWLWLCTARPRAGGGQGRGRLLPLRLRQGTASRVDLASLRLLH